MNTMCSCCPEASSGARCTGRIPGANHVRIALVAPLEECVEAAERIDAVRRQDYERKEVIEEAWEDRAALKPANAPRSCATQWRK